MLDVVLRHPKPHCGNRHPEIQAVCFTDDNQRIVTSDTLAICVWRNQAAKQRAGKPNIERKDIDEQ
jgi:hypothetical protein